MKTLKFFSKAFFLMAGLSSAQAADLTGPFDAQAVTAGNWSGLYVGAGLGYAAYEDRDARLEPFFPGFVSKGDDFAGSLHVGYNFQLGNIVAGVEADVLLLNSEFDTLPPGFSGLEVERIASARARLGYDFGSFMPYATGGLGYATTNIQDLEDSTGWVAGLGLDYKVSENLIFGVQYVYHRYDDFADQPVKAEVDLITARLSYKF